MVPRGEGRGDSLPKRRKKEGGPPPPPPPEAGGRGRVFALKAEDVKPRRMQSLCEVLEGALTCTAIVLHQKEGGNLELLVAANNELTYASGEDNPQADLLKATIDYFKELYGNKEGLIQSDVKDMALKRHHLLTEICVAKCSDYRGSVPGGKKAREQVVNQVVKDVDSGEAPALGSVEMRKRYGANVQFAGYAAGVFAELKSDFGKVEGSLTSELAAAMNAKVRYLYEADAEVKKEAYAASEGRKKGEGAKAKGADSAKPSKGVLHAEMQLLNDILGDMDFPVKGKMEIELSISKLCCLDCRVVIDALNEKFSEKKMDVNISYHGRHDLDHDWIVPELLRPGYEGVGLESGAGAKETFLYEVGQLAAAKADELKVQRRPVAVALDGNMSDSEPDARPVEVATSVRGDVSDQLAFVRALDGRGITLEQAQHDLAIVNKFNNSPSFKKLMLTLEGDPTFDQGVFLECAWQIKEDPQECLHLMQSEVYVGSQMASLFSGCSLKKQVADKAEGHVGVVSQHDHSENHAKMNVDPSGSHPVELGAVHGLPFGAQVGLPKSSMDDVEDHGQLNQ